MLRLSDCIKTVLDDGGNLVKCLLVLMLRQVGHGNESIDTTSDLGEPGREVALGDYLSPRCIAK